MITNCFYIKDSSDSDVPAAKAYCTKTFSGIPGEHFNFKTSGGEVAMVCLGELEYENEEHLRDKIKTQMEVLGL